MLQKYTTLIVISFAMFTCSLFYTMMISLGMPPDLDLKEEWLQCLLFSCYAGACIIFSPLYNILNQKIGTSHALFFGGVIGLFSVFLFAEASSLPEMILARITQGFSSMATWAGSLGIIAKNFKENRGQMLGLVLMFNTIGGIVGPWLGGYLLEEHGYQFSFYILAGCCSLDCCFRLLLPSSKNSIREFISMKNLIKDRNAFLASLVILLSAWCWSFLETLIPGYYQKNAAYSGKEIGLVFTFSYLLYGLACPTIGYLSDRFGPIKLIQYGLLAMTFLYSMMGLVDNSFMLSFFVVTLSMCYGFTVNPSFSLLAESISEQNSSAFTSAYALYNIAYSVGMIVCNMTNGLLVSLTSFKITVWFSSILLALGFIFFIILSRGSLARVITTALPPE